MSTLDELLKPLTRAEVEAYIYAAIKAKGTSHTAWKPGSFTRTIITVVAILIASLSTLQVALAKSAFLLHARGIWLTLLAKWVYGVDRDVATFATGTVRLTNTGGGVFNNVAVGALIVSNERGFKYRNTSMFSLAAGVPTPTTVNVTVSAVLAGSESSVGVDEIKKIEAPSMTLVTVTNLSTITGLDEQSDESLVEECLASLGASSPMGPYDAYEFAARNAKLFPSGVPANINRARTVAPDGTGVVRVVVASSSGEPSGSIGDLGSELGAAHDAMLRKAAPLCIDVETIKAVPLTINARIELTMPQTDGRSKPELQALLAAAFQSAQASVPISGWNGILPSLWWSDIIKKTLPTAIRANVPKDQTLAYNHIPNVTVTVSALKYHAS